VYARAVKGRQDDHITDVQYSKFKGCYCQVLLLMNIIRGDQSVFVWLIIITGSPAMIMAVAV